MVTQNYKNMENTNKTDLTKILSVSGQSGLFLYLAQARNGAIAESLSDKRRVCFDAKSKITSLADISIYTNDGEIKLKDVFKKMEEALGEKEAPSSKSSPEELKLLFKKAVPDYDEERFYLSHMKKVVTWYNELKRHASLEFVEEESQDETPAS